MRRDIWRGMAMALLGVLAWAGLVTAAVLALEAVASWWLALPVMIALIYLTLVVWAHVVDR